MTQHVTAEHGELLTVPEAAAWLKITPRTLYRWVERGQIDIVRPGGVVRITETGLREFITRSTHKASAK